MFNFRKMKKMRYVLLTLILIGGFAATAQSPKKTVAAKTETLTWFTDINEVNRLSLSTGKPVFLFFTGSDWCGWCKKLQADVFSKQEFIQWAGKNVILMEADFPRFKALPPELSKQNNELQNTFGVKGYPTIWIFQLTPNADGQGYSVKDASSLGYPVGSVPGKEEQKFLTDANAALAKFKK